MVQTRTVEIAVGAFVAAGLGALFVLAMKVSNIGAFDVAEGYELVARFDNVGGLKVRAPVTVGGVRVGRVVAIDYDMDTYEAVVRMRIDRRYDRFPTDTSASILTAGLLGEQYVGLEPGGEERYLGDGDRIRYTQSALVLEKIIGQFLYSKAAEGGGK
ncbi:MAG TPA: outer membrane lipid asymmetry maintenance protein MlaD [Chromatiales bacterium]|nr:outer membrane lipid asymmetry maintenance protein MlaD [Chromatiales bacterium]